MFHMKAFYILYFAVRLIKSLLFLERKAFISTPLCFQTIISSHKQALMWSIRQSKKNDSFNKTALAPCTLIRVSVTRCYSLSL